MMAPVIRALKWLDYLADHFLWVARLTIILAALVVAWFAADRHSPFEVVSVYPAEGRPGDWVTLTADVRRDTWRRCSSQFSRYIFDASGSRYDLGTSIATAEMIAALDKMTPGRLVMRVKLPETIAIGQAEMMSTFEIKCNRIHQLWPIHVTTRMPFDVLP